MVGIHGGNEGVAAFALCVITGEGRHCEGKLPGERRSGRDRAGGRRGKLACLGFQERVGRAERFGVPAAAQIGPRRFRSGQVRSGQRRVMALVAVCCSLREMGSLSVTTPHLPKAGPTPCQTPATVSESQSEVSQEPVRARRFPPACG